MRNGDILCSVYVLQQFVPRPTVVDSLRTSSKCGLQVI